MEQIISRNKINHGIFVIALANEYLLQCSNIIRRESKRDLAIAKVIHMLIYQIRVADSVGACYLKRPGSEVIKRFSCSTKHEIFPAHKM